MKKKSILIVDDSDADRYILRRLISETLLDVSIFEKNDGASALSFLEDHAENQIKHPDTFPPDLVFLDINMPLVDGFKFLEIFSSTRTCDELKDIVIIMYTSSNAETEKNMVMSYKFVKDYLTKGKFTSQELKHKIESYINI